MEYIKVLTDSNYEIVKGRKRLNEATLHALQQGCAFGFKLPKLTKAQQKQLVEYAIKRAELYPSTHSMRYSIMRDICKSIFE